LEKEGCVNPTLVGMVIILIFYTDNIVLMERSSYDIDNKLKILKDFFSNTCMIINNDKTKVMVIKSKKINYANFMYEKNSLEEVISYKYLGIDLHQKLN
jgi:hypothetical protein